jgi:hypothetical protein
MSTDDVLGARLAALANPIDDSDWLDVRRRVSRRLIDRRRLAVAAFAAALAIGIAAPAFGLHYTVIEWFRAEPAPERVQLEFSQLAIGAPEGMDPGVIPNSARKVTEVRHDGKLYTLWVAPTKEGGFCKTWSNLFGGCRQSRTPPPLPPALQGDLNPFLLGLSVGRDERGVAQYLTGDVLATESARIVADFADGDQVEIPVLWVSPPIDAGFFLYFLPAEHRTPGHHLTAVRAEDENGDLIARQTFRLTPFEEIRRPVGLPDGSTAILPAKAIPEKARKVIDFKASTGSRVTLWLVPTTDGTECWVHNRGSGGCSGVEMQVPLAVAIHGGARLVLISGQVRDDVYVVELHYQDGRLETLEPVEGFILHELPASSYERGHRLEAVVAKDADGTVLKRQPFDPSSPGIYPCAKPIDQGHGVTICP